jgi:hypothetical protein
MSLTGGCLCGAIRYSCDADPIAGYLCHCRDCQRASGGPFAACVLVPADALHIVQGTPRRYERRSDAGNPVIREHCGDCGTPLFSSSRVRPDWRVIRLGSLDDPGTVEPRLHIWVDSAQPWALPDDGQPRFSMGSGSPRR